MAIALRNQRAAVYTYVRGGSGGRVESQFTKQLNALATDGNWWCSFSLPTGRESTFGMQPEKVIDAVFAFGPDAPVTGTGAIAIDGEEYVIVAVLPRKHGHAEQQVYAMRVEAPLDII